MKLFWYLINWTTYHISDGFPIKKISGMSSKNPKYNTLSDSCFQLQVAIERLSKKMSEVS